MASKTPCACDAKKVMQKAIAGGAPMAYRIGSNVTKK